MFGLDVWKDYIFSLHLSLILLITRCLLADCKKSFAILLDLQCLEVPRILRKLVFSLADPSLTAYPPNRWRECHHRKQIILPQTKHCFPSFFLSLFQPLLCDIMSYCITLSYLVKSWHGIKQLNVVEGMQRYLKSASTVIPSVIFPSRSLFNAFCAKWNQSKLLIFISTWYNVT